MVPPPLGRASLWPRGPLASRPLSRRKPRGCLPSAPSPSGLTSPRVWSTSTPRLLGPTVLQGGTPSAVHLSRPESFWPGSALGLPPSGRGALRSHVSLRSEGVAATPLRPHNPPARGGRGAEGLKPRRARPDNSGQGGVAPCEPWPWSHRRVGSSRRPAS